MKLNSYRKAGFTLVEIMIVVAIRALLAAIAIPNFVKARTSSQRSACVANLKQISGAKATWALEAKKVNTDPPPDTNLPGQWHLHDRYGCQSADLHLRHLRRPYPLIRLLGIPKT